MEAAGSSETLVTIYQTRRCQNTRKGKRYSLPHTCHEASIHVPATLPPVPIEQRGGWDDLQNRNTSCPCRDSDPGRRLEAMAKEMFLLHTETEAGSCSHFAGCTTYSDTYTHLEELKDAADWHISMWLRKLQTIQGLTFHAILTASQGLATDLRKSVRTEKRIVNFKSRKYESLLYCWSPPKGSSSSVSCLTAGTSLTLE
jgi:hypothetical protein